MSFCPRRRSILASFSLTGILFAIILIHKNSENLQSETALKPSELRGEFVLDVGTSPIIEPSQIEKKFNDSKVRIKKLLKVDDSAILFREYTIFNNSDKANNLSSNNEKGFATKENGNTLQELAINQNGEGSSVKVRSKIILFSEVEPSDGEDSLIESENKKTNFSAVNNLEDNKKEIETSQLLGKSVTNNLESLKNSQKSKDKDEQSQQPSLGFMQIVNDGQEAGKYGNVKLEKSEHEVRNETSAINQTQYNVQDSNIKNAAEEGSSKFLFGKTELPDNSAKNDELKNYEKIFENFIINSSSFEHKSDKIRATTENSEAEIVRNNSTASIRRISNSDIRGSKTNISSIKNSNNSSSSTDNSRTSSRTSSTSSKINPKSEIKPLNLPRTNHLNQKPNSFGNESFSKKRPKGHKAPSYQSVFKQLIHLNKMFIKKIFSKERKDIDFLPGETISPEKIRRVLIVSTWRSGSTFLGDIFNSYPAAFYSFEPLHMKYRNKHLQKGEDIAEALSFIKDIFTCNFTTHHEYMKYLQEYQYVLTHNKFMWNSCYGNRAYCFDPNFMTQICKLTPLNIMKTVRLGLLPVDKLLSDETLNLKVIHLVRDPRGSLHSRIKLPWCKSKICRDPRTVCDSLYTDLKLSNSYLKKYPDRFQVIRYEDLSLNPRNVSEKILQFAGLHFHRGTENFLKEHTELAASNKNRKKVGAYTTFRDSQKTPFQWRESFTFPQINYIQKMCKNILDVLGLRVFNSETQFLNKSISVLINS